MTRPLAQGKERNPVCSVQDIRKFKEVTNADPIRIRYVRDIDGSSVLPKTGPRILRETSLALVLLVLFM